MKYRTTLAQEVRCQGIGVHSGKPVSLVLKPAPFGQGIIYLCPEKVSAHWRYIHQGHLATTLQSPKENTVSMVEHLLAACYGLGISDLTIELDGQECPIFDGSSEHYVNLLMKGGFKQSLEETSWIVLTRPLRLGDENRWIHLVPGEPLINVNLSIVKPNDQCHAFHLLKDSFIRDIAAARTFVHLSDVQKLRNSGHAKGGSLNSALVLHQGKPVNKGGFRFLNECARHKILDILGDFALLGKFFYGNINACSPGHSLNHQAIYQLMSSPDAFVCLPFSKLPSYTNLTSQYHF